MPNFLKFDKPIEFPTITDFTIWTLGSFILFSVFLHINKPVDNSTKIPDGFHELFNEENKITKKGMFHAGEQINGTKHVYKKDGTLSHIEKCTNGAYSKDI
ncbi:MAG: hypothetical protein H0U95_13780 [Bacteroidetes bacterium]|nr:hypothetical protein [Bacteroidota bacterium]